jgi:hypothetical protein
VTWWLTIAAIALLAVVAFALYRSFRSPVFVARIGAIITKALGDAVWKAIAPAFKPRPFTKDEKDRIKSGKPPFSKDR